MESWFWWVILAMILAGLHVFIQRIGSSRHYKSNELNTYSSFIAGFIALALGTVLEGWQEVTPLLALIAVANGTFYLLGSNLRMDAMRYIDTTILLPLHKFISPLFALLIGLTFFNESLSSAQWWGILLGALVPLLLITKSERKRQSNLTKGLVLVTLSAFIVVINAAVNKEVVTTFESVIMFAAISHLGTAPLGLLASYIKNRGEGRFMSRLNLNPGLLRLSIACGIVQFASFAAFLFAFAEGGPLAIVYTVHSLYILIPIVLSIIFFNEHWNMRKVVAIGASIAALMLLR